MVKAKSEDAPVYAPGGMSAEDKKRKDEDKTIQAALEILESRMRRQTGVVFSDPKEVKDYLRLQIAGLEHEEFWVLFVDAQHRLIEAESMFRGTLIQTSVYPREVVKRALHYNAAAVILAHNHPSGHAEPSRADEYLTAQLRSALALVDVRVLDHLVVGCRIVTSFAERGLL